MGTSVNKYWKLYSILPACLFYSFCSFTGKYCAYLCDDGWSLVRSQMLANNCETSIISTTTTTTTNETSLATNISSPTPTTTVDIGGSCRYNDDNLSDYCWRCCCCCCCRCCSQFSCCLWCCFFIVDLIDYNQTQHLMLRCFVIKLHLLHYNHRYAHNAIKPPPPPTKSSTKQHPVVSLSKSPTSTSSTPPHPFSSDILILVGVGVTIILHYLSTRANERSQFVRWCYYNKISPTLSTILIIPTPTTTPMDHLIIVWFCYFVIMCWWYQEKNNIFLVIHQTPFTSFCFNKQNLKIKLKKLKSKSELNRHLTNICGGNIWTKKKIKSKKNQILYLP